MPEGIEATEDGRDTVRLEDALLVARSRGGDLDAFDALVRRYQDRIYNLIYRMVGDEDLARDAVQDVFVKAFRSLAGFRGESGFYTWVYRIALNTAASERRKRAGPRGRVVSLDAVRRNAEGGTGGFEPEASVVDPSSAASSREVDRLVQAAIDELEEDFRVIVVLRDIEGLDYDRIGEILGLPRGTVKSRLHRARQALRARLQPVFGGAFAREDE